MDWRNRTCRKNPDCVLIVARCGPESFEVARSSVSLVDYGAAVSHSGELAADFCFTISRRLAESKNLVIAKSSNEHKRRSSRGNSCDFSVAVESLEQRTYLSGVAATGSVIENSAVTADSAIQQQPTVAVNPLDSDHVVIVYQDASLLTNGQNGVGVSVSFDAGQTWSRSSVSLPAGFDDASDSPIVEFAADGKVFVIFQATGLLGQDLDIVPTRGGNTFSITPQHFETNNGIFVSRSDDGGVSWNSATPLSGHVFSGTQVPFDVQPEIAIDTFATRSDGTANPFFGNIYASWVTYFPTGQFPLRPDFLGGGVPVMAVSRDGGDTWEQITRSTFFPFDLNGNGTFEPNEFFPVVIPALAEDLGFFAEAGPASSFGAVPRISIGPDGDVYIANFGGGTYSFFHSPDGGATILLPIRETSTRVPFGQSFFARSGFPLVDTQPDPGVVRSIVADPTQPGVIYAVEALFIADAASNGLDLADVFVAKSVDHGANWDFTFTGNGTTLGQNIPVNDDNGGVSVTRTQADPIVSIQALPEISVDASCNVSIIWYDTRRGLDDAFIDIFGTTSQDSGASFSPNYRITNASSPLLPEVASTFNPADELGRRLGYTTAGGFGYAAWTDFRNGSPDIFFSRFALDPVPAGVNDRFEQNDTPETSTDLGVIVQENITRLSLVSGENDWFAIEAGAIGDLRIIITADGGQSFDLSAADQFALELWNSDGTTKLVDGTPVLNEAGRLTGWQLSNPATAGTSFLVRVQSLAAESEAPLGYSLFAEALTEDFGERVEVNSTNTLQPGELATFRLVTPAAGSLLATVLAADSSQDLELSLIDAQTLEPLGDVVSTLPGGGRATATTRTFEQSEILVMVQNQGSIATEFLLELRNLDESSTQGGRVFSIPIGGSAPNFGDFNNDNIPDLLGSILVNNTVAVLPGNGDGTFQTARISATGAGLGSFGSAKDSEAADLNGDGFDDIVVANTSSADVSVLLSRGDGTFDVQRRFDTLAVASELEIADVNRDGIPDLMVTDVQRDVIGQISLLIGRGDGTFEPQVLLPTSVLGGSKQIFFSDFDNDGVGDIYLQPDTNSTIELQKGNGDGTFGPSIRVEIPGIGNGGRPIDVDGDGNLDILIGVFTSDKVIALFGNGDFTFRTPQLIPVGGMAIQPAAVDIGSVAFDSDGKRILGPLDGVIDLIAPLGSEGETGVSVLPGIDDGAGNFVSFGEPIFIPGPESATQLSIVDLDADGLQDIIVGDFDGLTLIFGAEPQRAQNTTPATARNLGLIAHHVEPTRTITSQSSNAYFRLQVPVEAVAEAGDQIIDFGGFFSAEGGAGLGMEVLDSDGNVIASGERFRLRVAQGEELLVHIFGVEDGNGVSGTGAYSLNINVLPQVVSVSAEPLLPGTNGQPGGPTGLLVLTLQGDRLDQEVAEDPTNYTVTFLGADETFGTADDRIIPLGVDDPSRQPVIANPSSNVDVSSGQTFATAIRQTVTLAFDEPLPAGSYRVEVSPVVQTRPFNGAEAARLEADTQFGGHPVVSFVAGQIVEGAIVEVQDLVQPAGALGSFQAFEDGTSFLTQLQNDLSFLLDNLLTEFGDAAEITPTILNQITDRFRVAIGDLTERLTSMLIVFLDPVSLDLVDPGNNRVTFDLQTNEVARTIPNAFVEVGGNVEIVVIPNVNGQYRLDVADVPAAARGGVVFLGRQSEMVQTFTNELRSGTRSFNFDLRDDPPVPIPTSPTSAAQSAINSGVNVAQLSQLLVSHTLRQVASVYSDDGQSQSALEVFLAAQAAAAASDADDDDDDDDETTSELPETDAVWDEILRILLPLLEGDEESADGEITPAELLRRLIEKALKQNQKAEAPPVNGGSDASMTEGAEQDGEDAPRNAETVDESGDRKVSESRLLEFPPLDEALLRTRLESAEEVPAQQAAATAAAIPMGIAAGLVMVPAYRHEKSGSNVPRAMKPRLRKRILNRRR